MLEYVLHRLRMVLIEVNRAKVKIALRVQP